MNRFAAAALALALLGAAPPAQRLVAGTFRDQYGAPIGGARVGLYAGTRRLSEATTAADGTFAVATAPVESAEIGCDVCVRSRATVDSDGIVVAIVHRFDAIRSGAPTQNDLAHLPYAGVESALSLTPYVILSQSSQLLTGPQIDDRRISGSGGLLVLNGVPDYDIESNATPYITIPDYDAATIGVHRSQDAYLYGDTANAGTFVVGTTIGPSLAAANDGDALRLAETFGATSASAGYSSAASDDRRARADANVAFAASNYAGNASLGFGRGEQTGASSALANAFSDARVSVERASGADVSASLSVDRGTYSYESAPYSADVAWSDVDARTTIRARSALSPFALLDFRRSTGETRLGQSRFVTGATLNEPKWQAIAAVGTDAVSYDAYDATTTALQHAHDGVISATWAPSEALSLEASARNGYLLPVFSSAYDISPGAPISIDQNNALESTLSYTDSHRFRASITALRYQDQSGTQSGSAGASLAWQASPKISVRTWLLRDADSALSTSSVGSTWLTYDNGAFRLDAIVQRDRRDGLPDAHFDGSITGALGRHAQWFVRTERRNGKRETRIGIRF